MYLQPRDSLTGGDNGRLRSADWDNHLGLTMLAPLLSSPISIIEATRLGTTTWTVAVTDVWDEIIG
jgi:hypothetical protein